MLSEKEEGCWRWGKQRMFEEINNGNVEFIKNIDGWIAYEKIYQPLEGEEATKKFTSWIDSIGAGTGSDIIKNLFNGKVFDYPKPIDLIKHFIKMAKTEENEIVLDFFSGSATTAHAVIQLNAEDGGRRKFIMVQLPEITDEKSEAYKAGYKNICDIGMERIRRAGKQIINKNAECRNEDLIQIINKNAECKANNISALSILHSALDIGFKVFELDTSNLKTWDGTPVTPDDLQILISRMNDMLHRVKNDRTDLDMIYEIMLKMGVPLTYYVNEINIQGKKAYTIGDDCLLLICLAENITAEMVEEMCSYAPAKLILGEDCLKDDTAMANADCICKDRNIEIKFV